MLCGTRAKLVKTKVPVPFGARDRIPDKAAKKARAANDTWMHATGAAKNAA